MLVPRAGTSFVQCFAWSAKRGQMCLVCPTPCAVCLGITGAEHTRPVLVPLSYSASLGQPRQCITCPGSYSYWAAKRRQMCLVRPTPCAVRLGITGAEHTRPCWYLAVPLSYSASLGQPRQCITCPGSYSYWSAKRGQMCLVCPTPCAVRLGITGAEHTRPCWYCAGTSFVQYFARLVQCFAWSVRVMYLLALVRTYTYLLCSWTARALYLLPVSLMYLRVRATCPRLYPCTVFLLWVTRAMYVSSCVDSRAVTVSLLPLAWTVCW